jgi:hypothetical protein
MSAAQLLQAVYCPLTPAPIPVISTAHDDTLDAIDHLVHILATLCASEAGWPSDLPKTAETLWPYVSEEAYEVLHHLQADIQQADPHVDPHPDFQADPQRNAQEPFAVASTPGLICDLIPDLLWGIARSAYETMRLLEGVQAQIWRASEPAIDLTTEPATAPVIDPGVDPQASPAQVGVLRLGALLKLHTTDAVHCLDLVTHSLTEAQAQLAAGDQIQVKDGSFCPTMMPVGTLLSQLQAELCRLTPTLSPFLTGLGAKILVPQGQWQAGRLQLALSLVFEPQLLPEVRQESGGKTQSAVPDPADLKANTVLTPVGQTPPQLSPGLASAPELNLGDIGIALTNSDWIAAFLRTIARQRLAVLLPTLSVVQALKQPQPPPPEQLLPQLVEAALEAVEIVQGSVALFRQNVFQQPIVLPDLLARLLWYVTRSGQDLMQWVGGVPGQVLLPRQSWQEGLLKLVVALEISLPTDRWLVDVADWGVRSQLNPLPTDAVVQTAPGRLQPVSQLQAQLQTALQTMTPEVMALLSGTEIDLFSQADLFSLEDKQLADGQPGFLRLQLSLEWISARSMT